MPYEIPQPGNMEERFQAVSGPSQVSHVHPEGEERRGSFARFVERIDALDWRYKALLTVIFCLAIVVPIYVFRDTIMEVGSWGYLGAFLINGLSNATIILPAPGGVVIAILAQKFNPLAIGVLAGIGGTLGGSTAYIAGAINTGSGRESRWFGLLDRWMARFGGPIIFLTATVPFLPGDLASLMAGGVRYPLRKYFLYNGAGSVVKMTAIAYLGTEVMTRLETVMREWAANTVSGLFPF